MESANEKEEPIIYRLKDVLARMKISKSSWWSGIRAGVYPRGFALGKRMTAWLKSDIDNLILSLSKDGR